MAPSLLLALALLTGDDAPLATQHKPEPVAATAPAAAPAAPKVVAHNTASSPPSDDYGYVSWCYGALGSYLELYDAVMPEVTRIESAFPGPDGIEADLAIYPTLKTQAKADLKRLAGAIEAAEKASPKPIAPYGAASQKKGRLIWGGGSSVVPKAKLARMWMSWSPPEKCEVTAKALRAKASVLGQALAFNVPEAEEADMEAAPEPPKPALVAAPAALAPTVAVASAPAMTTPPPEAPTPVPPKAAPPSTTPVYSGPPVDPGLWYRGVP